MAIPIVDACSDGQLAAIKQRAAVIIDAAIMTAPASVDVWIALIAAVGMFATCGERDGNLKMLDHAIEKLSDIRARIARPDRTEVAS